MSEFSNPPSGARRDAGAYARAVLELLGERDPLEVLSETPAHLITEMTAIDDALLRTPEGDGKWSAVQLLQHLADAELIYTNRYRFAVAQDGAPVAGFDQNAWVRNLWRGDEPLSDVFEQLAAARALNLRFLGRLDDDQWKRSVRHSERGRESVSHMAKLHAGHDLVHRRQLSRILDTVTQRV